MIPEQAVLQRSDGSVVFVVRDGNRAERRQVRLGVFRDGLAEVVEGVAVGEQVIVRGQLAARRRLGRSICAAPTAARSTCSGRRRASLRSRARRRPRARSRDALRSLDRAPRPHLDDDARADRVRRARLRRLGIDQFPSMDLPVLSVIATLEGADPEGMEEDVTDVLEEQLNTIAGVRSIESTTFSGSTQIRVEFELGTDLDVMAQEVRDKIDVGAPRAAAGDRSAGGQRFRLQRPADPVDRVPHHAVGRRDQRVPAARGDAGLRDDSRASSACTRSGARTARSGSGCAATRCARAGSRRVTCCRALQREHVEVPGGRVEGDAGRVRRQDRRRVPDARGARAARDRARGRRAGASLRRRARRGRRRGPPHPAPLQRPPTVGHRDPQAVGRQHGAIVDEVFRRLDEIKAFLPEASPSTRTSRSSISRPASASRSRRPSSRWCSARCSRCSPCSCSCAATRPTLIVATAIPISLIATFGLVWLFGYTLNTMTLLGMTLAVGVVIDDAIVVLENIERHRERGEDAYEAARDGTREIAFAATAATFSVAAVFLPVVFVEGVVGSFLGEFGLTVAGSVLISLFVALTLTPMLAARMKPPAPRAHGGVYHRLEQAFAVDRVELPARARLDARAPRPHDRDRAGVVRAWRSSSASALEGELFPPADEALFFAQIETAPGTSLEATLEYLERDETVVARSSRRWPACSRRSGDTGPEGPEQANAGHAVRHADAAQRARAHRPGADRATRAPRSGTSRAARSASSIRPR